MHHLCKLSSVLIVFGIFQQHIGQSDGAIRCICPKLDGYISYNGSCSNPLDMLAVKRTLMGKTLDKSNPNYCSNTLQMQQSDCILYDVTSSWPVRATCNSVTNRTCQVTYTLDSQALGACQSQKGYVYGCLEYDCVSKNQNTGSSISTIYLSSSLTHRSYEAGSGFQLMTSYYPSATSASSEQCTFRVTTNYKVLIRIWDLRGRFISSQVPGSACPYRLYINSGGSAYKSWCAESNAWEYQEVFVSNGTTDSSTGVERYTDIVFYSQYSSSQAEGALWITVETNSQSISVLCGDGIPLYNTTGHDTVPPTTTTTTTSTKTTTTTTTTRSPSSSSSTTRQPPGPPGPGTSISPNGPSSSTTRSTTATTTTKKPSTTIQLPSVSTVKPGGPSISQAPTTASTRSLSPNSFTPGVPTPGVPRDPNAVEAYTYSKDSSVKNVAITVTVIVGGLIIIASIIMALVWYFKMRHEISSSPGSGLTRAMEGSGEENNIYEEQE